MITCEQCRSQMLPYQYDLLEPADRLQVSEHLQSCPACQDPMKIVQEQAGMLAEAVKLQCQDVSFKAPQPETAIKPAVIPSTKVAPSEPLPRRRSSIFLLNRWSIAATILLVIFSGAGVIGWFVWDDQAEAFKKSQDRLADARRNLMKTQEEVNIRRAQTTREIQALQQQFETHVNEWKNEEVKARKVLKEQNTQIIIKGPQAIIAGARNSYEVELRQNEVVGNLDQGQVNQGQKGKAGQQDLPGGMPPLQARLINQKNQQVLSDWQKLNLHNNNRGNYDVPSDIPIKPGDDLVIEFQTEGPDGKVVQLRDNLKLIFPEYVTHLAADRPLYRPGDIVRFRSLTLERFSLKPAEQAFHLRYRLLGPNNVEIHRKEVSSQVVLDKNNEPIKGPNGKPLQGIGAGEFTLPPDLPGGQYVLSVSEVNQRFNEEQRPFIVHRWQTPRFNKELTFQRASYGPGDTVRATVRITPLQGPAIGGRGSGVQVSARLQIDANIFDAKLMRQTDNEGRVTFDWTLPEANVLGAGGKGRVTISVDDGGGPETLVRALPLALRDLSVDFYPEGGDLVAGLPNRVYFQARSNANSPVDIQGRIVDEFGQEVTRIQTLTDDQEPGINQGLGSFSFTPQLGRRYALRLDSPIGIDKDFAFPVVKDRGIVLNVPKGVADGDIQLTLQSANQTRELLVGAYCRGRMLAHAAMKADSNKPVSVTLKPESNVAGVYRITVFEKLGRKDAIFQPLAERLVYRKNSERVDVSIQSDRPSYQPGQNVRLSLQTLNEKKVYVPTVALLAVVDSSVIKLADEKVARSLPTHFLLTTEIRNPEDLEHADVLLGEHPKAAVALDLLLGSQGWRRFAEQDPQDFQRKQAQQKPPVFLTNSVTVQQFLDSEQKEIDKLDQAFVVKAIDLQKSLAAKEQLLAGAPELQAQVERLEGIVHHVQNEAASADMSLAQLKVFFIQFGLGGALLTLLFIGFYLISVGLRRLSEGENPRNWFLLGLGLFGLLFFTSIIGTFMLMGENFLGLEDMRFRAVGAKVGAALGAQIGNQPPLVDLAPPPLAIPEPPVLDEDDPEKQLVNLDEQKDKPQAAPNQAAGNMNERLVNAQANFALLQNFGQNFAPQRVEQQDDRTMRQQGQYQEILLRQLGRRVQMPPVHDPSILREYAHKHKVHKDDIRRDFAETVYWHPVLVLPDGKAEVQFDLSDSVTRFQVLVLSHTFDGRLGAKRLEIASKLPFSLDPRVPIEVTNVDEITIPVVVSNTQPAATSMTLIARAKGVQFQDNAERGLALAPVQVKRELFKVKPTISEGTATVRMIGRTTGLGDAVERKFTIAADGFPVTRSISGVLENSAELELQLPDQWIPGTLKVQAHLSPSPLAELQNGLESLLREPVGCFEQSSSSNYPNVLILEYLKRTAQVNPLVERDARSLLHAGYQKLTSFECIDPAQVNVKRGYEWFGQTAPPHEALTAYGLLQFRDMTKVYPVEQAMLERTEKYLLDQRDKKGGFVRNPANIDRFGWAPDHITNAYIVWALSEGGSKQNLDTELDALRKQCKDHKDPYFHALAGLAHVNRGKLPEGIAILQGLRDFQKGSGEVAGAQTSITGSQGRDLLVETTALAVLGWLKADRLQDFDPDIHSALRWLRSQRRGKGDFGSTQATVLALKAMVAYAQKNPRMLQNGEVQIRVRQDQARLDPQLNQFQGAPLPGDADQPDVHKVAFTHRTIEPLTVALRDVSFLRPGKNIVELSVTNNNALPYTLTWSYRTQKPENDPKAPVKVSCKFRAEEVSEGETVKLNALIENVSGKGQGMTIAILGIPGGLKLPEDFQQLKNLTRPQADGKPGTLSAWELRGRDLVLYWRELAPDAKIALELDVVAQLPGFYRGPASRAYLYYDADRKFWAEPLSMRIVEGN